MAENKYTKENLKEVSPEAEPGVDPRENENFEINSGETEEGSWAKDQLYKEDDPRIVALRTLNECQERLMESRAEALKAVIEWQTRAQMLDAMIKNFDGIREFIK